MIATEKRHVGGIHPQKQSNHLILKIIYGADRQLRIAFALRQ
jgi:hypothetical protein